MSVEPTPLQKRIDAAMSSSGGAGGESTSGSALMDGRRVRSRHYFKRTALIAGRGPWKGLREHTAAAFVEPSTRGPYRWYFVTYEHQPASIDKRARRVW